MRKDRSLRWVSVVTAEKVEQARKRLGLGETATYREMRLAYLTLSRKYHPDICPDKKKTCEKIFSEISAAWALLRYLVRNYKYSLREVDIKRDQEPYETTMRRRFGDGLYPEEGDDHERFRDDDRDALLHVTAENVSWAKEELGLADTITKDELISAYRRKAHHWHPDAGGDEDEFVRLKRAYKLLDLLIDRYNYSFRPDTIRLDQEDHLARHRRQYGNDPIWAGGDFDDPDL